jgi:ETC complex I subunit-like protein
MAIPDKRFGLTWHRSKGRLRFKSTAPTQTWSIGKAMITARIYKPARAATQSAKARTKQWMLDYEPEEPREIEPLMGWTASGDMRQQVRLRFDTAEEAISYCKRHGIPYQVFNPKPDKPRIIPYADNFSFKRTEPWTH